MQVIRTITLGQAVLRILESHFLGLGRFSKHPGGCGCSSCGCLYSCLGLAISPARYSSGGNDWHKNVPGVSRQNRPDEGSLAVFPKQLFHVHGTRQSADDIHGVCRGDDTSRRINGHKSTRGCLLPSVPAWNWRISDLRNSLTTRIWSIRCAAKPHLDLARTLVENSTVDLLCDMEQLERRKALRKADRINIFLPNPLP